MLSSKLLVLKRILTGSPGQFVATVGGLALFLWLLSWSARPQMSQPPQPPEAADLAAFEQARDAVIDPQNLPRVHVEVDYAEGPEGSWFPRGESPILAELVEQGQLPPVAERVGQEPRVLLGVDGIGRYGGTWFQAGDNLGDLTTSMSASTLVCWSPQGYPIVPNVARAFEIHDDYRVFTFHLRRGMRWSDGRPFTADDILYWWEAEASHPMVHGEVPAVMRIGGQAGRVEKVDDFTVRFVFPEPHGLFLPMIAGPHGMVFSASPRHYLQKYHPDPEVRRHAVGHEEDLVDREMHIRRLDSPWAVYMHKKAATNPEHPRLGPWLLRTYSANAPFTLVRNAYYWAVDPEGNQLPYIDRITRVAVNRDLVTASIVGGRFDFTINRPREITLLMANRHRGNYRVHRWFRADRSDAMIHVNINRHAEEGDPHTQWKSRLLREKTFRQALSLGIDRQQIIRAAYFGETEPAQVSPGPQSAFHHEGHFRAFTDHDVEQADRLLDELGLTQRDRDGYRMAPDGTRLTFFLNHAPWLAPIIPQFIVEDWRRIGIRTIPRMRDNRLFYTEKAALQHDFTMFTGENEFVPILEPRVFLPISHEANFALGYARWYLLGGLHGDPAADAPGSIPVPEDHPLHEGLRLYEQLKSTGDFDEQKRLFDRILEIAAENVWTIGICTTPMYVVTVANDMRGVPPLAAITFSFLNPAHLGVETFHFDPQTPEQIQKRTHTAQVRRDIQREIMRIVPEPHSVAGAAHARASGGWAGPTIKWLLVGSGVLCVLLAAVKHPYIARRLLLMVPTLAFISIVVFTIIELPPGDYLTSRVMELEMMGDGVSQQELESIRRLHHMDDPVPVRYLRWLGVPWFASFQPQDEGLLQGNLGRSMADNQQVNQLVGDRILLTVLISLGTILFTWAIAIPVGIYSAVRQYSAGDYAMTLLGFIGMCVPNFLLALILMYVSQELFGITPDGLFSPEYAAAPWSWGKALDLMQHIWVPVVILGVGGTAGMIRVMRGNLLDELRKPYITTARAKGVRPVKLLMKYPVRLALNPFISGIGALFPMLISGGTLVAVVLSLPTIGPMMLQALLMEDTMLAGSLLMVLSLLGVLGVLISDLLLLWLDPRIRFEGGSR